MQRVFLPLELYGGISAKNTAFVSEMNVSLSLAILGAQPLFPDSKHLISAQKECAKQLIPAISYFTLRFRFFFLFLSETYKSEQNI